MFSTTISTRWARSPYDDVRDEPRPHILAASPEATAFVRDVANFRVPSPFGRLSLNTGIVYHPDGTTSWAFRFITATEEELQRGLQMVQESFEKWRKK